MKYLLILVVCILSACGGSELNEENCLAFPIAECATLFPGGYAECNDAGECVVKQWPK